jgi:hypothetical protein
MVSGIRSPPSGPPARKVASSTPIGTRQISETMAMIPIGMSRSVMASSPPWPARRLRSAASAPVTPVQSGIASLASVQIAATPIAPAPMKRT